MTPEEFERLCTRSEGETLDFKQNDYDLSTKEGQGEFIKDILSMANTPRDGDAHIVLGVRWSAADGSKVIGLSSQRDDAFYQDVINSKRVSPRPKFYYTPLNVDGQSVGVISIPRQDDGPFTPTGDYIGLQAGAVYFRRGSTKARAIGKEHSWICTWFGSGSREFIGLQSSPVWHPFLESIGAFNPMIRYVLVADRVSPDIADTVEALGLAPWRAVIDLDRSSEANGLFKGIAASIRSRRVVHRALAKDLRVQPEPGIHWYFASGVEDNTGAETDHRGWIRLHKRALSNQLGALQGALGPAPITVIVLWSVSPPARLRTVLEELQGTLGESATLVVVGQDRPTLEPICEEIGTLYFDMSLQGMCAGIASVFISGEARSSDAIQLPTASGAPWQLSPEDYLWLSENLEIVHLSAGLQGDDSPRHFRLGSMVSWRNLQLTQDCTRDLMSQIRLQVEDDLRRRDTVRINLYHAPGGGGSTVARRIVWDLHGRYPVVVLLECNPRLTAERIARIGALTENSILVLVDGGKFSDRDIDELFEQLKAQQSRVVLLQALRRFLPPKEVRRRQFWLPADLTDMEGDRFRTALVSEAPHTAGALAKLASESGRSRSPFFFGLTAFGRDFRALPSYVAARLAHLTDAQRHVIAFVCFAYYYGQQPLPAQCFSTMLGLPSGQPVILANMFQGSTAAALELLVEDPVGEWRSVHHEVALEALQQIIAPGSADDRAAVWRQSLSSWSKDFATLIRTEAAIPSERLLELARRVFVYRDNTVLLGTERVAGGAFSQLIEDIPSTQGRIDVLRHVCEQFPDEAHFHAHLGRLLGSLGDFKPAVSEVDCAVALSPKDHVLHHMRGMILRHQVRSRFEAGDTVSDIIPLVVKAQASFAEARDLRPDDEHSYVSEIQLLLQFLDAAAAQHSSQVLAYISSPLTPAFCRTALEQGEMLIDRVSHLYVGETPSRYVMDCRARMQRIYGDYSSALRLFDNLISRADVAKPPVRRQIVWTILRRHDGQWTKLSTKEVDRVRSLLDENLLEETRDSTSLRLWLRVIRLSSAKPSLDSVIERVAYWKLNTGSLDAVYYLYVLHSLRAMEGSEQAVADMERALEECRSLARYRRDRTRSLEWIGKGSGIAKLVHQSQLGDWQGDFFESPHLLAHVEGRVKTIDGPQKGVIAITGGLDAFFVPARSDIHAGRDENVLVSCHIGFSYDGLRAWAVKLR